MSTKLLIKEFVYYNLILEAQSMSAIASAISNFLRIKYKNMSYMAPSIAVNNINSAVDDMMRVKGLGEDERLKSQLIDLIIKDLTRTGDLKLKVKHPLGEPEEPSVSPQRRFSLRNLMGL